MNRQRDTDVDCAEDALATALSRDGFRGEKYRASFLQFPQLNAGMRLSFDCC
jgi:hypothetical protein